MPRHPNVETPPRPAQEDGGDFVLGDTLAEEDGAVEVQWAEATYQGASVTESAADRLLLKSQADALYQGSVTGGSIGYLAVDASGGDVTEALPSPTAGAALVVVRVDGDSSSTGAIEFTGGTNIEWRGRGSETTFFLPPLCAVLFVGAETPGGDLYWHLEDDPFGRIRGFAVGQPSPTWPLMGWVVDQQRTLLDVEYAVGTAPSGNPTLSVEVNGSSISDVTLSGGGASDTLDHDVGDGDDVQVTIDVIDPALRDVKILFTYV